MSRGYCARREEMEKNRKKHDAPFDFSFCDGVFFWLYEFVQGVWYVMVWYGMVCYGMMGIVVFMSMNSSQSIQSECSFTRFPKNV